MTARFAGSRTLDERRRRWLATHEAERTPAALPEKSTRPQPEDVPPKPVNLRQFPVRKIISPKGWKIGLASLLVGMMGVSIIAAGAARTPGPSVVGPGWHRLLDADGGRLARTFQAGLLMLAGHLAFLIWWGRRQSLRDFDGQYRIWLWAAAGLMLASWSLVGGWHWAFSETLCWLWPAKFPQREIVCWMFPSAVVAGTLWRRICTDMRHSKSSFLLLWLAGLGFAAACVFRLGIDRTDWLDSTRQLAGASLEMLAVVGVFTSLLVHARYVLHVSPEPPQNRPGLWKRAVGFVIDLVQKLPKPRLSGVFKIRRKPKSPTAKAAKKTPQSARQKSRPASEEPAAKKASPPAKNPKPEEPKPAEVSARADVKTEPKPAPVQKPAASVAPAKSSPTPPKETPRPETKPPVKSSAPAAKSPEVPTPSSKPASQRPGDEEEEAPSQSQLRVDVPLEPEMLKGLSKKERRKLRKQHRDAQRQGG